MEAGLVFLTVTTMGQLRVVAYTNHRERVKDVVALNSELIAEILNALNKSRKNYCKIKTKRYSVTHFT